MRRTVTSIAVAACIIPVVIGAMQATRNLRASSPSAQQADSSAQQTDIPSYIRNLDEQYQGIKVTDVNYVEGLDQRLFKEISSAIEKADFIPEERIHQFAWIDEDRKALEYWTSTIKDVKIMDQGFLVQLIVYPVTVPHHGSYVGAYATEYYNYVDGQLVYLKSDPPRERSVQTW